MRKIVAPKPKYGDIRIQEGFLWLPLVIGDEERWLENATWEEKFTQVDTYILNWTGTRWLDGEKNAVIAQCSIAYE